MFTEKLRVLQLVVLIIIASQGMFYLLAAAEALRNVSVQTFAEQRKAIDIIIGNRLRILYYSAIIIGLVVMAIAFSASDWKLFFFTTLATILVVIDIMLALKFNVPINIAFSNYPDAPVKNWQVLQLQWLRMIEIRGMIACTALLSLLISWFRV